MKLDGGQDTLARVSVPPPPILTDHATCYLDYFV